MANLNFSEIPSREPLAEGIYLFTIEEVTEKVSSTGNDMLLIRFKEQETGVAVFENYVLTPSSLWKLKELCDALGIDTSADMSTDELIPMLKGEMIKGKVTQDLYNDNIVNRMKKVYAA